MEKPKLKIKIKFWFLYDIVLLCTMELKELVWNDFNSKHILKHKVTKTETNQACTNKKNCSFCQEQPLTINW